MQGLALSVKREKAQEALTRQDERCDVGVDLGTEQPGCCFLKVRGRGRAVELAGREGPIPAGLTAGG